MIFKMFNLIGIGEHAGSGVPDIFDVWKSEGLPEPTIEEQFGTDVPDRTTLTLPLFMYNQDKLNKGPEKDPEKGPENKSYIIQKRRVKVFNLLKANKSLSKPKIAKELDITERQIKDVFDYLIDNGYIHHEGPAKGGEWIIDKEYK